MITVRTETRDGSTFLVAEGPSQDDIRRTIHERLVAGINGKIDMAFARELVRLGWTPPPGHPVLAENGDASYTGADGKQHPIIPLNR